MAGTKYYKIFDQMTIMIYQLFSPSFTKGPFKIMLTS